MGITPSVSIDIWRIGPDNIGHRMKTVGTGKASNRVKQYPCATSGSFTHYTFIRPIIGDDAAVNNTLIAAAHAGFEEYHNCCGFSEISFH